MREADAKYFNNKVREVPNKSVTVGIGTIMDAKEVMILVTGAQKSLALHKAIEEGINHMWPVSAFQVNFFNSVRALNNPYLL
jgi:glucosamine-6-phosphate deaminase